MSLDNILLFKPKL